MSLSGLNRIEDIINYTDIISWYSASDLTSLNQGDKVTTWIDKGLSGYTLTRTNPLLQPSLNIDSEGYRSVLFDSTNTTLSISAKTLSVSNVKNFDKYSLFAIYQPIVFTGTTRIYFKKTGQPRPQMFILPNLSGQEVINSEAQYLTDVYNNYNRRYSTAYQFDLTTVGGINNYYSYNNIFKTRKRSITSTGNYGNGVGVETQIIGEAPSCSFLLYELLQVRNIYDELTTKKIMRTLAFKNGLLI